MRLTADWLEHLHAIRARELEIIFSNCPPKLFATGLEIGAGDGFQAQLLTRYVTRLISTDYHPAILANPSTDAIRFMVCDAELVDRHFDRGQFEVVFSSNVLEHLPDPQAVLRHCYHILADDGIAIHVLPTPFWKLLHLLFHFPSLVLRVLERLTGEKGWVWLVRKLTRVGAAPNGRYDTNPKTPRRRRRALWKRVLIPEPHGISRTNREEFRAFSAERWQSEFRRAGFEIVDVRKGPVASGYGFGLDLLRSLAERFGLASELAYILGKPGSGSHLRTHFERAGAERARNAPASPWQPSGSDGP